MNFIFLHVNKINFFYRYGINELGKLYSICNCEKTERNFTENLDKALFEYIYIYIYIYIIYAVVHIAVDS